MIDRSKVVLHMKYTRKISDRVIESLDTHQIDLYKKDIRQIDT